jgi:hypothetical protein
LRATLQTPADAVPAEDEFWGYVYLSGAIHRAEATQLRDALRELWDFRKS